MGTSKLFFKTVEDALKHFHDPDWLSQNSSLATPYFLGDVLLNHGDSLDDITMCGSVLSSLLLTAAKKLWQGDLPFRRQNLIDTVSAKQKAIGNKGGHYYFLVLELRYFRQYFSKFDRPFDTQGYAEFLGTSDTRFNEHRKSAIQALIVELLKLVRPTFRLEQPRMRRPLLGRDTFIETVFKQLHNRQAVTLTGTGGIGKTALGTVIYNQWEKTPAFWYTFRMPLNDQSNSLLFSLAHFLNQQGRSTLWLQLMVDGGRLKNHDQLRGCLAHDLQSFPLLCFDEVDRLATINDELPNAEHLNILELLEILVELTPVLLIGQKLVIDTPAQYQLSRLSLSEATQLLAQTTQTLDKTTVAQWYQFSHGNPRLLLLFAMLHSNGEHIRADSINLSGPFQRLWRRLSTEERNTLALLSVFRSPAPADAWQNQQILNSLIKRQLVTKDANDGVELLSLYRRYLYQQVLLRETREYQHERAAEIRAERGEYTVAAFHYVQAGEASKALAIWYPHLEAEITRGFGAFAREVFADLSTKQLSTKEKTKLQTIRHRLSDLMGDLNAIIAAAQPRTGNTVEDAILDELEGRAYHLQGQPDRALTSYNDALTRLAELISQSSAIHFRRGRVFFESQQLQEARNEAQNIFYFYKRLQAIIARRSGDFKVAEAAFLAALASADHLPLIQHAAMHQDLMFLYGQQGQMERVIYHAELAMKIFKTMGHQFQQGVLQAHLAAMYMQDKQYEEAIDLGEKMLQFFKKSNHTGAPVPDLFNTLAESYFETGNMKQALTYAQKVLHSEERQLFPYGAYTLARIHVKAQKYDLAHYVFKEALQVSKENEDIFIRAYLLRERGELHRLENNVVEANRDKNAAAILFRKMGPENES